MKPAINGFRYSWVKNNFDLLKYFKMDTLKIYLPSILKFLKVPDLNRLKSTSDTRKSKLKMTAAQNKAWPPLISFR